MPTDRREYRLKYRLRLAALVVVVAASAAHAEMAETRFFVSGDGHLRIRHGHFNESIDVRYRRADGSYDDEARQKLRRFFRSRGDGREGDVALRSIELLDYVEDTFRPRQMTLISGYRSTEFNDEIRGAGALAAQTSLHTQGLAIDVALAGVDLRRAWNRLREERVGGVGLYRKDGFLHLDTGRPRFWEPTTSKVGENLSAGNAKLFARTDFDRYGANQIRGAAIRLHSVTALPVRIRPVAKWGDSPTEIRLAPGQGMKVDGDGCITTDGAHATYELAISSPHLDEPPRKRTPLRLVTCEPRVESTPAEIVTNEIELTGP